LFNRELLAKHFDGTPPRGHVVPPTLALARTVFGASLDDDRSVARQRDLFFILEHGVRDLLAKQFDRQLRGDAHPLVVIPSSERQRHWAFHVAVMLHARADTPCDSLFFNALNWRNMQHEKWRDKAIVLSFSSL
jgi:hypothetical protein